MDHQTFADGIGRITIIDGIVRLDLVSHSATEADANGQPKPVFAHRIVMGVDQFVRAAQKITETNTAIAQCRQQAAPAQPRPPAPPPPPPAEAQTARPQAVPPQFRRESVRPDAIPPAAAAPSRPFP